MKLYYETYFYLIFFTFIDKKLLILIVSFTYKVYL